MWLPRLTEAGSPSQSETLETDLRKSRVHPIRTLHYGVLQTGVSIWCVSIDILQASSGIWASRGSSEASYFGNNHRQEGQVQNFHSLRPQPHPTRSLNKSLRTQRRKEVHVRADGGSGTALAAVVEKSWQRSVFWPIVFVTVGLLLQAPTFMLLCFAATIEIST